MHTKYCGRSDHYALSPIRTLEVNDVDLAFPADISRLMPTQEEIDKIPEACLEGAQTFVSIWFHLGLDHETRWIPAPGVYLGDAFRHLDACMRSFEPKHEDKLLGCAALVSRFFADVKYRSASRRNPWSHMKGAGEVCWRKDAS